ncbi:MAG: PspC domain-containing protein [bacterium]|nr:PspC domain-containing protein [bacterium]
MTETKKLYRQDEGKVIAGVATGIAQYFNLDPIVVRVLFVLLTFFQGAGILLYIILAVLVPKPSKEAILSEEVLKEKAEQAEEMTHKATEKAKHISQKIKEKNWLRDSRRILGVICVLGGVGIILNKYFFEWFKWDMLWTAALVVVGFYLVITENKEKSAK